MLTPAERALLVGYCNDHPVATCPRCSETLTFDRIGADPVIGTQGFCPTCRADVVTAVRRHIAECTATRVQVAERLRRGSAMATTGSGTDGAAA